MAEPVIYREHNCTRQHRTYATMAKCLWPRAVWVNGEGPYATVAYCNGNTSIQLHEALEEARASMAQIDATGCGSRCGRRHKLLRLELSSASTPSAS